MSNATATVQQKKHSGLLGTIVRRFFLCLFTILILGSGALALVMNLVFNGPSPAARKELTMTLSQSAVTEWVPSLFLDQQTLDRIVGQDGVS